MSFVLLLAEVRPTDVWDLRDVIGAVVLVGLLVAAVVFVRVARRR